MAEIAKWGGVAIANVDKLLGVAKSSLTSIYGLTFPVTAFYGYTISQSCRFNKPDSAYMHKTPGSAGDRRTWVFATWVKRDYPGTGNQGALLSGTDGAASYDYYYFQDYWLRFLPGGGAGADVKPKGYYRDVGQWMHIVFACDTTQGTAANRVKIYVNGALITVFETETYPALNYETYINDTQVNSIGALTTGAGNLGDFLLAQTILLDGQSLVDGDVAITDFGTFVNGIWTPKDVSGLSAKKGTNGFLLMYEDSANLGNDSFGGTDFTEVNLAATDQMADTPTNNFCTMNPLSPVGAPPTYTEGNLKVHDATTHAITGTNIITHKAYWEIYINTYSSGGLLWGIWDITGNPADAASYLASECYCWIASNIGAGDYYVAGVDDSGAHGDTAATDKIMIAYDPATGKLWLGKNGTWNEGDPATASGAGMTVGAGIRARMTPYYATNGGSGGGLSHFNFGQDSTNVSTGNADDNGYGDFEYDVPAGFLALCSANMPDPAWMTDYTEDYVDDGFNVVLYTGDATDPNAITGVGHQPDLLWIKNRDQADDHHIHSSVALTGVDYYIATASDASNAAETQNTNSVKSIDADGFTLGTGAAGWNDSAEDFVSYSWKKSATYGTDLVSYEGTGSNRTVSHSLGIVPDVIIIKQIDTANGYWAVYHSGVDSTPEGETGWLNTNQAFGAAADYWNNTAPTSSVFSLGTSTQVNKDTDTHLAILFASIEGFSKFGSYEGNGSTDGAFVYCGFRPALIICKSIDSTSAWHVYDDSRVGYNVAGNYRLNADTTAAESTSSEIDILSNGFKIRIATDPNVAETYVFMAWAEQTFRYSNAR